jgi:hypothetical protein
MDILIFRTEHWHITAPLVCDHPFVHDASDNSQDFAVEEKLRGEAWRIKRHCQKMAARTSVRFSPVHLEVLTENRQKRVATFVNKPVREMVAEYAKPVLLEFGDVLLSCHSFDGTRNKRAAKVFGWG